MVDQTQASLSSAPVLGDSSQSSPRQDQLCVRLILVQLWVAKCHTSTSEVFFPWYKILKTKLFVFLRISGFFVWSVGWFCGCAAWLSSQPGMEARPQQETLVSDARVNNWDPCIPWGLDSPSEFFVLWEAKQSSVRKRVWFTWQIF